MAGTVWEFEVPGFCSFFGEDCGEFFSGLELDSGSSKPFGYVGGGIEEGFYKVLAVSLLANFAEVWADGGGGIGGWLLFPDLVTLDALVLNDQLLALLWISPMGEAIIGVR